MSLNFLLYFFNSALPQEPFPRIYGCNQRSSYNNVPLNCNISTASIDITCSTYQYYPLIDLTFRHKSELVQNATVVESVNSDGTMNKSVTVEAAPSNDPYVCQASEYIGSPDHVKSAIIYIKALPGQITTEATLTLNITKPSNENKHLTREYITLDRVIYYNLLRICTWSQ